jgi:hypothetical protein
MALHPFTIAYYVIWFLCGLCALSGERFLTRPEADAQQNRTSHAHDAELED